MARCFLTGVEFPLEDAFVLNRREARLLIAALNNRSASLRRLVDQFSPMDEVPEAEQAAPPRRAGFARKNHRLVCKAVATALAPGYPEISLFVGWLKYRAQVQSRESRAGSTPAPRVMKDGQPIERAGPGDEHNQHA